MVRGTRNIRQETKQVDRCKKVAYILGNLYPAILHVSVYQS